MLLRALIALFVVVYGVLVLLSDGLKNLTTPTVPSGSTVSVPVNMPLSSGSTAEVPIVPDGFIPVVPGAFSMADKFRLFLSLGANPVEATLLTAICTAENRSGNPNAVNKNISAPPDDGLCQINEMHAAMAGGAQNLFNPTINAEVALALLRSGGPKQWCTYPGGCGGGPGVPDFANLLAQAQAVATGLP